MTSDDNLMCSHSNRQTAGANGWAGPLAGAQVEENTFQGAHEVRKHGIYPGRVMRENKWKKTPYPQLIKYCKT